MLGIIDLDQWDEGKGEKPLTFYHIKIQNSVKRTKNAIFARKPSAVID